MVLYVCDSPCCCIVYEGSTVPPAFAPSCGLCSWSKDARLLCIHRSFLPFVSFFLLLFPFFLFFLLFSLLLRGVFFFFFFLLFFLFLLFFSQSVSLMTAGQGEPRCPGGPSGVPLHSSCLPSFRLTRAGQSAPAGICGPCSCCHSCCSADTR